MTPLKVELSKNRVFKCATIRGTFAPAARVEPSNLPFLQQVGQAKITMVGMADVKNNHVSWIGSREDVWETMVVTLK